MKHKPLPVVPIVTWGPTKIFAYEECPKRTQLRYGAKLCPLCFKGRIGFDAPCDKCGVKADKPAPLARGIEVDEALAAYLGAAKAKRPDGDAGAAIDGHPVRAKIFQVLRKAKGVTAKAQIGLDAEWRLLPPYTKGPWFWGELDVLVIKGKTAGVIDWKTGNIDKRTGEVRYKPEYEDQLEIYGVAVLCAYPDIQKVEPMLVFTDARPPHDPVVKRPPVLRKDLDKLKAKWKGRLTPMFVDEVFAPRPGFYCGWCDYSKRKGGPCAY